MWNWVFSIIFPRCFFWRREGLCVRQSKLLAKLRWSHSLSNRAATFKANKGIAVCMSIFDIERCHEQYGRHRLYERILRRPDVTVSLISFSFERISLQRSLTRVTRENGGDGNLRFVGSSMRNPYVAIVFKQLSDSPVSYKMYQDRNFRPNRRKIFCVNDEKI